MMMDILQEIETKRKVLDQASHRLKHVELTPEQWSRLEGIKLLIERLEGKITALEDSLVKCCACLDYYGVVLEDSISRPFDELEFYVDPIDDNERMVLLRDLIGGFTTLGDLKEWKQELIGSNGAAMEQIISTDDITDSIKEWAESAFVSTDYVLGLLRGLSLSQDKRISTGVVPWESIIGVYLGLSKYYVNRYRWLRR